MTRVGTPDPACRAWVSACLGETPERFTPIAPGLGHRTFFRVSLAGSRSAVLRIDPPATAAAAALEIATEPLLEPIRSLLERAGLPVPVSLGHDLDHGWDLLEDVGDASLEQAAAHASPRELERLYGRAAELVGQIQRVERPEPAPEAFSRKLDRALIATKATKMNDWLLPECLGRAATDIERGIVATAFDRVADLVEAAPERLAHRDYKAANIHLVANTEGGPDRLVLIDLQGAFMAPPEYDLVCLLRDSHVPLRPGLDDALFEAARAYLPAPPDAGTAQLRFDALTLTRVGKDLAHYVDAARQRGDTRYLGFVPTGLANLRSATGRLAEADAGFGPVADLIARLDVPVLCEGTACAQ